MNSMKRFLHTLDREAKRDDARDRAQRKQQIANDLLHDGLDEYSVTALLDADAPAKLVDFFDLPLHEQNRIHRDAINEDRAYEERLWEEALVARDADREHEEYMRYLDEMEGGDSYGDSNFLACVSIQEVWGSMGEGMRGYSISTRPVGGVWR